MNNEILLGVRKPARYIGQEWNVSRKDFEKSGIKFGLCFPDLYEIGMSNLGVRILYGLLNKQEDVACERIFSSDLDMESLIRAAKTDILSLESGRKLREFDILGFSLASELDYTNVLNLLDLGGIPLKASLRDESFPLVIAGGPSTLNPEPMHEFFDIFVIGEAEEALLEVLDVYRSHQALSKNKQELLLSLAQIEGIYVPSLYEARYSPDGSLQEFKPKAKGVPERVRKRFVLDLDASFFPVDWLVPYIQIVHDRITVEIMRGCPNKCRFCQARSGYYPFRVRNVKNIIGLAEEAYRRTGYEEISLCGLSVSDHPGIEEISKSLIGLFKERAVSLSLPSVKPKDGLGNVSSVIAGIKKTGLTFAPEAGNRRLREAIGKDFDEEDFFQNLERAYSDGYQRVKLYFMIGLAGEEEKDLEDMVNFAKRVSDARRKSKNASAFVNISVNTLIPKPHTAMQWLGMSDRARIQGKQDFLKSRSRNRNLVWSFHGLEMSLLEGALSRGDRRISGVIERAFNKGARFDAWSQYFSLETWRQAFQEAGVEFDFYLREKPRQETLPWDFIDTGVSKEYLVSEFNKLFAIKQDTRYNP